MPLLSDILLIAGTFGVALYALILSTRLKKLTRTDSDMMQAIQKMNTESAGLLMTLKRQQNQLNHSVDRIDRSIAKAEETSRHLELLIASMHSLPTGPTKAERQSPFTTQRTRAQPRQQ